MNIINIEKAQVLVGKLLEGMNIAVITDAGTPGISGSGRGNHEAVL